MAKSDGVIDSNFLYDACTQLAKEEGLQGFCLGYISGLGNALDVGDTIDTNRACVPQGVSPGQGMAVVKRWLKTTRKTDTTVPTV